MTQTLTDLELVRGLHARSAAAFSRVYDDYHAGIYNLCARILDDREEARDVTQDVFIKAFSSPPAAEGEVRLRAWLYRVATNACLNTVRGRRPSGGLAEADNVPAMNDGYEQSQSAALIEQSLGRLNPRYRAALVLKDLHGLGGDELAEVLEVSRPAADVLVHRARASFKKAFAGLAGEGFVAPANLALALPALSVPSALQVLPPLPAALAPPHATAAPGPAAPLGHAVPGLDPSSFVGPAGVGLLAKLAATAGTKAAIVVGSAAIIAGGGLAVRESRHTGAAESRPGGVAAAAMVAPATHETGGTHHGVYGGSHDSWAERRHAIAEHLSRSDHVGARHSSSGSHASDGHAGQAAQDGELSSSAAATRNAETHATSPTESGTATTTHAESGDGAPAAHEGDVEH
jgi:RNA polymerase sigma-70 factor (ECF subfamily)